MSDPVIIVPCQYGGYIVKKHAVYDNDTRVLFAGALRDCVDFVRGWFEAPPKETPHD